MEIKEIKIQRSKFKEIIMELYNLENLFISYRNKNENEVSKGSGYLINKRCFEAINQKHYLS